METDGDLVNETKSNKTPVLKTSDTNSNLKPPFLEDKDSVDLEAEPSSDSVSSDSSPEPEEENFESVLKICGDSGCWQIKVFVLTSFCGFLTALHNLAYGFIGAAPSFYCNPPSQGQLPPQHDFKSM